jgi:hypothetical protein
MKRMDDEKNLFHDAAMESALQDALSKSNLKIKDEHDDKDIEKDNKNELLIEVEKRVASGESSWDILSNMISGGFTKRFIEAMDTMPDKDFVRNYIKIIEHFKPKLIRSEGAKDDRPDNIINIQQMIINEKGEKEIKYLNKQILNDEEE